MRYVAARKVIPEFQWHRGVCKKSNPDLNNVVMLVLGSTVLLVCLWVGY